MSLKRILASSRHRAALLPDIRNPENGYEPASLKSAIANSKGKNAVIAEIKYSSPSEGGIREGPGPAEIATMYAAAGCVSCSVLTEPRFFSGKRGYIQLVKEAVDLPVLRKDFIVDIRQLSETRALGADAVLLIAAVLEDRLDEFVTRASELALEPLVEVHTRKELDSVLKTDAELIGINCRDLRTMRCDPGLHADLAGAVREAGATAVAESGLLVPADLARLKGECDAFLIGTALMKADDPGKAAEAFVCV